jgi:carbon storage regulator CsrA
MLLVACKIDDGVTVEVPGHGIVHVMVTRIRSGEVRLGITAPREWPVVRDEVRKRSAQEVAK